MMNKKQSDKLVHPSDIIAAKYGYTVVEDVKPSHFKVKDIKFIPFLKSDEDYISGETMCQRAVTLNGNFGLVDGQYLLDHQKEIPKKMRGKYIVLPGTLLCYLDGDLCVAYLDWCGGQWDLFFHGVKYNFIGFDRFVRYE